MSKYTFGDSDTAARRLGLLARVFADTTGAFVRRGAPRHPALAVDLGCGPGHTTELLIEALRPRRTIAVDGSVAYVEAARARLGERADVVAADVTVCRFLLTHLTEPLAALAHWVSRLAAEGVVLVEEVESITTTEPTLDRYLALQREMLAANRNTLDIGPALDRALAAGDWTVRESTVATLEPSIADAAGMFAMNLNTIGERVAAATGASGAEVDELAERLGALAQQDAGGDATISWRLRQVTLGGA